MHYIAMSQPPTPLDLQDALPPRVRWTAVCLAAGAALTSAFSYEGPYRWLAELQLAAFGRYFEKLTFLATLIVCALTTVVLVQLAKRVGLVRTPTPAEVSAELQTSESLNEKMSRAQGPLTLFVLGAVTAFVGARDLWTAEQGRTLQKLTAAELEHGAAVESSWLEIAGAPLGDEAAVVATLHGTEYVYMPLVSEAWRPAVPIGVLLMLRSTDAPQPPPWRGTVSPEGLPGMVRAAYEKLGIDARRAIVVQLAKRPGDDATKGRWLLYGGLLVALIGAAVLTHRFNRTPSVA